MFFESMLAFPAALNTTAAAHVWAFLIGIRLKAALISAFHIPGNTYHKKTHTMFNNPALPTYGMLTSPSCKNDCITKRKSSTYLCTGK